MAAPARNSENYTGFPKLKPAFTMRMETDTTIPIGRGFGNTTIRSGPISHGTIESVPGYGPEMLHGEVVHGNDVYHVESDLRSVHLQFGALIMPPDGESISMSFTGYILGNNETIPLFNGDPTANSTGYGSAFLEAKFETGNPKWDLVNRKIFVGSQRLIREPGKPMGIVINLSEVYYSEDPPSNTSHLVEPSVEI